jgi:predicted nucleic acid-binding protein
MARPISDLVDPAIYLDTNAFYYFLRGVTPAAQSLFHAIQVGSYQAYTSVLTFDELAYRILLALIRDKYGNSPQDRLRQAEHTIIAEFYPQVAQRLEQLQNYPNLHLVDVTASDLDMMHRLILQYHLRPRDGLHLAAMYQCGCLTIVSQDADFDHVPGIQRYTLL